MKQKIGSDTSREELTRQIIDLFVSIIGFIPKEAVSAKTNFISEFEIIDDDLTCFMMQVKWQYKLNPDPDRWHRIETIEQLVDVILSQR
ncbi:acyl carrier protein [Pseudomonas sp. NPDC088444]|uniref:acyl carrier protein n=1 Tax=Pseudomonas sp. NPDC088444 TaxID=3364456 RepID=UPI00384DCB7A